MNTQFTNDTKVFGQSKTLLIDGDLMIYRKCCVHNEDDDIDRRLITTHLRVKVSEACQAAGCDTYRFFLTTTKNFRHWVASDYKEKRKDIVRPINLAYAKQWAVEHLGAEYETYLEADDLMSIHQTKDTVIYSGDKDLRQVPGWHLNDSTHQLEYVEEFGSLWMEGDKVKFNGYKGLMFQCLTGDTTDSIMGCGAPRTKRYKSGKHKGEECTQRAGIGPKEAYKILNGCVQTNRGCLTAVLGYYEKQFGNKAVGALEQQCNLLHMVQEFDPETKLARMWTIDRRDKFIDITTGEIV